MLHTTGCLGRRAVHEGLRALLAVHALEAGAAEVLGELPFKFSVLSYREH